MLFDWFTAGAQTLNFLILVWLMKRFLYKPIIDAIDAREKRIALALEDAASKYTAAVAERDQFRRKNADFDQQRSAMLSKVKDEMQAERQRLLDDARQSANDLRLKHQDALTNELDDLQKSIAHRSQDEVFAIAQKVLTDLAGVTLEARMSEVFTQRLKELSEEDKVGLAKSLKVSPETVRVRSAFELLPAQRSEIQVALNEAFSEAIQIRFDTTPNVISGIELTANGWKLAWNIADFLTSLKQSVDQPIRAHPVLSPEGATPEKVK